MGTKKGHLAENLSDNDLIKKCLERSEHWNVFWNEFEKRFGQFILYLIVSELKKHWNSPDLNQFKEAIKDIRQEVYAKLLKDGGKALKDFRGSHPDSFKAYLKTIAVNLTKNFSKNEMLKRRRVPDNLSATGKYEPDAMSPVSNDTKNNLDEKFVKEHIIQALTTYYRSRKLERDIAIFKLYFFESLTSHEIQRAIDTGLTVSGIETIISRTKQALEKIYLRYFF